MVETLREGERCSWEKKLSLVNLITLVSVRLDQTQQPNTLHLHTTQAMQATAKYTHNTHLNTCYHFCILNTRVSEK